MHFDQAGWLAGTLMVRYRAAKEYLGTLEGVLRKGWMEVYKSSLLTLYEKLALLHPDHLDALNLPAHQSKVSIQRKV